MRTKILNKLLILFSVAVLIPIAVIHFFYYPGLTRITERFIDNEISSTGEKITEYMNSSLRDLLNIAAVLNSQKYSWGEKGNERSNTTQAVNLISSLVSQNSTIEKMFIFTGDYFLSDTGRISRQYFGEELFPLSDMDREEFYGIMEEAQKPVLLPTVTLRPSIYPISGNDERKAAPLLIPSADKRAVYLFFLSTDKINGQLCKTISDNFRYAIWLESSPFMFTNLTEIPENGSLEALKRSYTMTTTNLKYLDLSFSILFDSKNLGKELASAQTANTLFIIGLVILYLFSIVFFIRKNYRPIVSLLDKLGTGMTKNSSEFELISQAVNRLQDTNCALSLKVNQYQSDFKNTLLYQILSDRIVLMNNISDIEDWLELPLNDRLLYAGFINFKNVNPNINVWGYMERVQSAVRGSLDMAVTPYFEKHCLFFLLSSGEPEVKALINRELCVNIADLSPVVILAEPSASIYEVKNQVNACILNLQIISGLPSGIYTNREISESMGEGAKYPYSLVLSFNDAIAESDADKIRGISEKIKSFLSHASLVNARMVFSQIMYVIFQSQYELESEMGPIYERINEISIKEMQLIIDKYVHKLSSQKRRELNENSFDHIREYINESYLSSNFSIKSLSEKYHMQVSNMSAAFKKRYGITFQDYVGQMKIAKAKQLLLSDTMDIEEISNLLNYSNSSSFGRAFKKVTGNTPGEYRLLNRQ